jgi:hypothetical protein
LKPISPVAYDPETRWGISEITFAKNQPEYIPLPALRFSDGLVVTRWKPSFLERLTIALGGDIYLGQLTFNNPLQPVILSAYVENVVGTTAE